MSREEEAVRKLVLIACLAAAAVWPAAARADGIAFAGVAHMGSGVASADERFRYGRFRSGKGRW